MTDEAERFLGGQSYPAVKFDTIGDGVTGTILDDPHPVTLPNKFKGGALEENLPINIEKEDGELVTLWVKPGYMRGAIAEAKGRSRLEVGGKLRVKYVRDEDTGKGNPAKVYEAQYKAPERPAGDDTYDDAPF